jgi:hypothetical protein
MAKIYKTMLISGGGIQMMDTIEFEGAFWLIPEWLVSPDRKQMRPLRGVSLQTIPHQDLGEKQKAQRFVVNGPIPESVFRGLQPPEGPKFEIREELRIVLPNPDVLN